MKKNQTDHKIKNQINRSKDFNSYLAQIQLRCNLDAFQIQFRSTDDDLDYYLNRSILCRSKEDAIQMQFRSNLDAILMQF